MGDANCRSCGQTLSGRPWCCPRCGARLRRADTTPTLILGFGCALLPAAVVIALLFGIEDTCAHLGTCGPSQPVPSPVPGDAVWPSLLAGVGAALVGLLYYCLSRRRQPDVPDLPRLFLAATAGCLAIGGVAYTALGLSVQGTNALVLGFALPLTAYGAVVCGLALKPGHGPP